jgi:hypothetical protein
MIGTTASFEKGDLRVVHAASNGQTGHISRSDALTYKALFLSTFIIFLAAVIVRRALPGSHRPAHGIRRSVFEEAKISASTASAYAFMG